LGRETETATEEDAEKAGEKGNSADLASATATATATETATEEDAEKAGEKGNSADLASATATLLRQGFGGQAGNGNGYGSKCREGGGELVDFVLEG